MIAVAAAKPRAKRSPKPFADNSESLKAVEAAALVLTCSWDFDAAIALTCADSAICYSGPSEGVLAGKASNDGRCVQSDPFSWTVSQATMENRWLIPIPMEATYRGNGAGALVYDRCSSSCC